MGISLAALRGETSRLLNSSVSTNTRETYHTGLDAFLNFLNLHNFPEIWPPPLSHVTQFIAYLSLTGKAWSTARTYLSAVGFKCKLLGCEDITSHFMVQKMLEGMKRLKTVKDARLPITIDLLKNIINALPAICSSHFETLLFRAAFCLAFFGFLRVGELTVGRQNDTSRVFHHNHVNIVENRHHIELTIPYSKTDQLGVGKTIVIPETGCQVCPLFHMRIYLQNRPNVHGPFFCHFGGKPLTRYQFTAVLSKVLTFLGVDTKLYKSHSFRIGAASFYHLKGESDEQIKIMGRWKSRAFQTYIRIPRHNLVSI